MYAYWYAIRTCKIIYTFFVGVSPGTTETELPLCGLSVSFLADLAGTGGNNNYSKSLYTDFTKCYMGSVVLVYFY